MITTTKPRVHKHGALFAERIWRSRWIETPAVKRAARRADAAWEAWCRARIAFDAAELALAQAEASADYNAVQRAERARNDAHARLVRAEASRERATNVYMDTM